MLIYHQHFLMKMIFLKSLIKGNISIDFVVLTYSGYKVFKLIITFIHLTFILVLLWLV